MAEEDPNLALGAAVQHKFHFYVLGLTFGVLALSIQTASFQGPPVARIAELGGWVLMFLSGVVGLWRLESVPILYNLASLRERSESRAHELQAQQQQGFRVVHVTLERRDYPIEQSIAQAHADIAKVKTSHGKVNRGVLVKYQVQRYTFLLGLLALMVARGYAPLLQVIREM